MSPEPLRMHMTGTDDSPSDMAMYYLGALAGVFLFGLGIAVLNEIFGDGK